jgi:DNA-binding NarL/FixJ family response regulator
MQPKMKPKQPNNREPQRSPGLKTSTELKRKVRVVIADESTMCRRGLGELLREDGRFEILAELAHGEAAFKVVRDQKPDVAVLDAALPGINGLEFAALLEAKEKDCETKLVIFAMQKDEKLFNRAISLGIRGYVLKRQTENEILSCIAAVASGEAYVSPLLTDFLLRRRGRTDSLGKRQPGLRELTAAERRILKRIALGKTSREIAMEGSISPRTVESHRAHIREKLGLRGSNQLLQFALEHRDALSHLG